MTDAGKRPRAIPALVLAFLLGPFALSAQQAPSGLAPQAAAPQSAGTDKASAIPGEFRGIKLGMSIEQVQTALAKDSTFDYRGPDDVTLLPSRNQSLVEATGQGFVRRAFFQFIDGKLWTIIVFLNPDRLDHYSVYTSLVAKYGEPASLSPSEARWEDQSRRMALERPLTLRYMDMKAYSGLVGGSEARAGAEAMDRQDFLGGL